MRVEHREEGRTVAIRAAKVMSGVKPGLRITCVSPQTHARKWLMIIGKPQADELVHRAFQSMKEPDSILCASRE